MVNETSRVSTRTRRSFTSIMSFHPLHNSDLLGLIFAHLADEELPRCSLVCSRWEDAASRNDVWDARCRRRGWDRSRPWAGDGLGAAYLEERERGGVTVRRRQHGNAKAYFARKAAAWRWGGWVPWYSCCLEHKSSGGVRGSPRFVNASTLFPRSALPHRQGERRGDW